MRVLVVDDDPVVRGIVRASLERENIQVTEAGDADQALRSILDLSADLAVLDLHLPGMSGLKLLARLRQVDPALPVIILTASGSEADRVLGLASGADDYVVKPFSPRELAARVMAVGRRHAPRRDAAVDTGDLRIDVAAREASFCGKPLDLTRREFDLLHHLAAHPGRTFTRAQLLHAVWGSSADWQSEATVTEHVRRLRNKLEVDPGELAQIVTVRGSGYRFDPIGTITASAANPDAKPGAPAADLTQDPTLVIVGDVVAHANPAALALLGAARSDEVCGHQFVDFVAPHSLGAATARHQSANEGRWPRPDVITIVRVDGAEVLVELASMPTLWAGQPASQITLWDLAGDTSKLRELVTGVRTDVAEAIIITDARLRIQSLNPAAEELYGWSEDEVIGRPAMEVLPWLDGATLKKAREAFQRDGRWHGEIVQRRRDGSSVAVRSSSTLLRDGAGRPVGIVSVNRPVEPAPPQRAVDRISAKGALRAEIRRGIERREFTVHYQPVVRLDDGSWVGAEALVRWQHPDRGLLEPAAFIDVAERSGDIVELGHLVIDAACRQWSSWQRAGIDRHVAVNLSGRQLADPNLVDRLADAMASVSMPPGALWLELTETALVEDLGQATKVLLRIAELGAHLSIDDFGTGWASLTYLREFPVHALKIDRVFVHGLNEGTTDAAIVRSIISLGAELDVSVIAEGIETPAQLAHLRQAGCQLGQGYLFARPLPPDELTLGSRS